MPNLFYMVGCVEKFYLQFGIKLTHYDINYICSCCSNLSSGYYNKIVVAVTYLVCYGDLIPGLLEQSKFVNPRAYCIFFFLLKHTVFSINIPFSDFWCLDSRNIMSNLNFMEV